MIFKYFFLLPILEIVLFILFGDFFGFFPVIFSILTTGFVGIILLRSGINAENIALNPKEWIFKKIAAILLIIPGFVTDTIGVFLLIKSLRYLVWNFIPENARKNYYNDEVKKKEIIDVDYKDLDEK